MRVFLTGATGFIGSAVTRELIGAGHSVLGMARSDAGARALTALGSQVHRGSLEDLESLKAGAAQADAVVHLGFIHDFSKFQENCAIDSRAIEALGDALAGTHRPLIAASGLAGLTAPGRIATEKDLPLSNFPFPRISEPTVMAQLKKDVGGAVMRLPQVHDPVKQGLITYLIAMAREKGVSAYVGDGESRWAAAHVTDVARLYRLALEQHEPGARYHAVAEEGVRMRDIAEAIGKGLNVPVVSIQPEEAAAHFGWMSAFVAHGIVASSAITREKLGWKPEGPGLLEDLARMDYSSAVL